jgi:hypothetical protein
MSNTDVNGVSILPFIQDSDYVTFNLTGAQDYLGNLIQGYQTWYISNASIQNDNNPATEDATLLIINQPPSSDAVTSYDSLFYDLTFSASGVFSYYATASGEDPNVVPSTGITQSVAQGYFPPVPTFPTESFFRGWGKSNYFEGNADGTVYRVETGSGFSTDTLGNFNTGSVEMDFDSSIPYTSSIIPWFINAPASTYHALQNSSLVGSLSGFALQMYTGSLTASAVPIGPSFTVLEAPTPELTTVLQGPIFTPPPASLYTQCSSTLTQFQQVNYFAGQITITCTDQSLQWFTNISYQDGNGWITLSATSGTGDAIITVNVANDTSSQNSPLAPRSATVTVNSLTSPGNNYSCTVTQQVYSNNGYAPPIP